MQVEIKQHSPFWGQIITIIGGGLSSLPKGEGSPARRVMTEKSRTFDLPVGVTTVGEIRKAGGDVVRTSGRSPYHATLTGLIPEEASKLLTPTILNPIQGER